MMESLLEVSDWMEGSCLPIESGKCYVAVFLSYLLYEQEVGQNILSVSIGGMPRYVMAKIARMTGLPPKPVAMMGDGAVMAEACFSQRFR